MGLHGITYSKLPTCHQFPSTASKCLAVKLPWLLVLKRYLAGNGGCSIGPKKSHLGRPWRWSMAGKSPMEMFMVRSSINGKWMKVVHCHVSPLLQFPTESRFVWNFGIPKFKWFTNMWGNPSFSDTAQSHIISTNTNLRHLPIRSHYISTISPIYPNISPRC